MVALVTLDQVNRALKLDLAQSGSPPTYTDERTPDVELKIEQGQAAVLRYLKSGANLDWTAETVPADVKAAIILWVGSALDDDKNEFIASFGSGVPSVKNPIGSILHGLRDPALA